MNNEKYIKAFKKLAMIRFAESFVAEQYLNSKIFSFLHLSIGQEAVAVGLADALSESDVMIGNHRSHAHFLAKGGDLHAFFKEIFTLEDGCAGGAGGSMHMLDRSVGFAGSTPILGSAASIGLGFAFEKKYRQKLGEISVSIIGDGASEEGCVYESLNMAATYKLPYILVIENNLYAVNSSLEKRRPLNFKFENLANALGCCYYFAEGNNYNDTWMASRNAVKDARNFRPVLLELRTYREMAHSGPMKDDSAGYRYPDNEAFRKENDPLKIHMDYCINNKIMTSIEAEEILSDENLRVKKVFEEVFRAVKYL